MDISADSIVPEPISRVGRMLVAKIKNHDQRNGGTDISFIDLEGYEPKRNKQVDKGDRISSLSGVEDFRVHDPEMAELDVVYQIGLRLQQRRSPGMLAQETIRILEQTLGYQLGAVLLVDKETNQLKPFALSEEGYGPDFTVASDRYVAGRKLALGQGVSGEVAKTGRAICVEDVGQYPDYDGPKEIVSLLSVPIWIDGVVVGVMNFESTRPGAYTKRDQQVVEAVSAQLALAIQNAHLRDRSRRSGQSQRIGSSGNTLEREEIIGRLEQEISDHRRTELALRESQAKYRELVKELRAQNEELNAFSHTVAHALKNPLSILLGFAEVLEHDPTITSNEVIGQSIQVILENGRRLENIISELLLLAEVRQRDQVEVEPLNMDEIIKETRKRLHNLIDDYGAVLSIPNEWPRALGHKSWVEEIWTNYVSNAIKYGGSGPELELGYEIQSNNMIRYWVRDNGPGITPEDRNRLFRPFTRLDQLNTKGHGLGLSIVHRIATKLGGDVGVESEPGQGSLFWFTLPKA